MTLKLSSLLLFLFATAVLGSGIGYSKLYLFHIALVLFTISFFYYISIHGKQLTLRWPKSRFIYFFYFMFSYYALSILWSIEPLYTLRYLFYLLVGISIVFLMNAYIGDRQKYLSVFKVLSIFFILAIVIALFEVFTSFRLPTSPYSDYAALFGRKGADFLEFESSVQSLIKSAPTSFWGNPNNFAVVMVLILPFFLMHKKTLVRVIGAFTILIVIVMAGSRGGFLAFLFGIGLYFFIRGLHYWLPMILAIIVGLLLFANNIEVLKNSDHHRVAQMAWAFDAAYLYLFDKEESLNSIGSRQLLIQNGLNALWDSGGLGVGGGASQAVQEQLGGEAGKLGSMHNFWIEVLVDAGVAFFIFFMTWYLLLTYRLYRVYKKSRDRFYRYHGGALFISMMAFLLAAVSASSVIYLLPMWLMFGFAIALISLYKKERLYENNITRRS